MQFMLLMIPKGYETAKPGTVPTDAERVAQMMKFNQALKDAGVLVSLNGLHPVSAGARVSFAGGKPTVIDGPFVETKEVLGGYWVIRVSSKEEAIEWAKRCPGTENETIEIRQVQSMEDFPADVQKAAEGFAALQQANGQYVDGFVLPVPRSKVEDYRRMAANAGNVWKEHGALAFVECLADDVKPGKLTSFPQAVNLEPDETVVFSYIVYPSRAERDRINELVMKDPRLDMNPADMPFDAKRMIFGGFNVLVEA
jgi:uncharacterized protein YbaA (DUF1428 family)